MDTKKKNETAVESGAGEGAEGARKLQLTVTRMKKLRSEVKAGSDHGGGGISWNHQKAT